MCFATKKASMAVSDEKKPAQRELRPQSKGIHGVPFPMLLSEAEKHKGTAVCKLSALQVIADSKKNSPNFSTILSYSISILYFVVRVTVLTWDTFQAASLHDRDFHQ